MLKRHSGYKQMEDYLKGWTTLTGLPQQTRDYYSWRVQTMEPVTLATTLPPELERKILTFTKVHQILPKSCYNTAWMFCLMFPEAEYVLGTALGIIAIEHAWCCIDNTHFDLLSGPEARPRYSSYAEHVRLHADTEVDTPYMLDTYYNHVKEAHRAVSPDPQ